MPKIAIIAVFALVISGFLVSKTIGPKVFKNTEPTPSPTASQAPADQPGSTASSSATPSSSPTKKPAATAKQSASPTGSPKTSSSPTAKPSPQSGVYKLDPSLTQDIKLKLSVHQGYNATVLLKDSNGDVIADQSDFNFEWTLADTNLVIGKASQGGEMYGGCTGSSAIKNPCPNNSYIINYKDQTGSTTLSVKAVQKSTGKTVGEFQFNITVEK